MERHLEKNAGSTFREVIMHAERRGKCMYWGFQQRSPAWQAAIAALRNLTAQDIPPRLCIEAHSGIDYGVPWLERFAQLRGLRSGRTRTPTTMFEAPRRPLPRRCSFRLGVGAFLLGLSGGLVPPSPFLSVRTARPLIDLSHRKALLLSNAS